MRKYGCFEFRKPNFARAGLIMRAVIFLPLLAVFGFLPTLLIYVLTLGSVSLFRCIDKAADWVLRILD